MARPRKYDASDPGAKYRAYRARKSAAKAEARAANPPPPRGPRLPEFIAVDGEGRDLKRRHIYILLGASDGSYIESRHGLKTRAALDYILSLRAKHPRAVFVGYGFDYDVNMMLGDIALERLERLRKHGSTLLFDRANAGHAYRIEYVPGKWFGVGYGPLVRDAQGKPTPDPKLFKSVRIYDAFGFFQSGFTATLDAWSVGTEAQRAEIATMKGKRAVFSKIGLAAILAYNQSECTLLVELMGKLALALHTAGIKLPANGWYGAGAIGSWLLKQHEVKAARGDDPPGDVQEAALRAYFGGRIQLLQVGEHSPAYSHDINSAYPAAMVNLPDLRGRWGKRSKWSGEAWALWRVSWSLSEDTPVCPFPWRDTEGAIHYPYAGEGWYWTPEVRAALDAFGDAICIHQGYAFTPSNPAARSPFYWVADWYQKRLDFKAQGDPAQVVIKFGLNSLYGKLAQGVGYYGRGDYQSFVWAGLVTSITRARLFALAMRAPESVISFATDNVFATRELVRTDAGKPLGGWELGRADRFFIVQPGVYEAENDGQISRRARGFRLAELDFDKVRHEWRARGVLASIPVKVRRFVGMRGAAARADASLWRTWVEEKRPLSFAPGAGWWAAYKGVTVRVLGEDCSTLGVSGPYKAKGPDIDTTWGLAQYEATEQPDSE